MKEQNKGNNSSSNKNFEGGSNSLGKQDSDIASLLNKLKIDDKGKKFSQSDELATKAEVKIENQSKVSYCKSDPTKQNKQNCYK